MYKSEINVENADKTNLCFSLCAFWSHRLICFHIKLLCSSQQVFSREISQQHPYRTTGVTAASNTTHHDLALERQYQLEFKLSSHTEMKVFRQL